MSVRAPLTGDWDGDGVETIGLRRSNTFFLSDSPGTATVSKAFVYGDPNDIPVVGRFNPGNVSGIGVARPQ